MFGGRSSARATGTRVVSMHAATQASARILRCRCGFVQPSALGQLDELNLGEVARSELVGGAARRVFTRLGSLR